MKGNVKMKCKKAMLSILIVVSIITTSACGTATQLDNNIGLKNNGDNTTFEFRDLQFSVPGSDWKHSETSGDEPVAIDCRSKTYGGLNIIGFSEPKSNYSFLEQAYEKHETVSSMFDGNSDTKGLSSKVSRYVIKNRNIYVANTAIEEKDENGSYIYDFVISMRLGENNYCDIFFFIKADNENDYAEIREEIVKSINFIDNKK